MNSVLKDRDKVNQFDPQSGLEFKFFAKNKRKYIAQAFNAGKAYMASRIAELPFEVHVTPKAGGSTRIAAGFPTAKEAEAYKKYLTDNTEMNAMFSIRIIRVPTQEDLL